MWKNVVERGRPQMAIWRMRIACWMTTATHTQSEYETIIRVMKSRRLRWAGHVACMGGRRSAYMVLVGTPEGKRPLGRSRRRWENNIKMDLQEERWRVLYCIDLDQDRDSWRGS